MNHELCHFYSKNYWYLKKNKNLKKLKEGLKIKQMFRNIFSSYLGRK